MKRRLFALSLALLVLTGMASARETGQATHVPVMQKIQVAIPDRIKNRVQDDLLIPAVYLALLARLSGGAAIAPDSGEASILYNEGGEPEKRIERFGDSSYGLVMEAEPIASGVGVHGETGEWTFKGLPEGMRVTGRHRLDLRGGDNYLSLSYASDDPARQAKIAESFALVLRELLAGPAAS